MNRRKSTEIDKNRQESRRRPFDKNRNRSSSRLNRQVGQIISILDHLLILRVRLFTLRFIAFDWLAVLGPLLLIASRRTLWLLFALLLIGILIWLAYLVVKFAVFIG